MRHLLLPMFLGALDIISAAVAAILAVYVRFDFKFSAEYFEPLLAQLPFYIVLVIVLNVLQKLYSRIWRHAGSSELIAVFNTAFASSALWYLLTIGKLPRSIYVISGLVLMLLIGASRMALRVYAYLQSQPKFREKFFNEEFKRVLIVGAGDAGATIAREIGFYNSGGRKVIGFIDDDPNKIGKKMFGAKVLGDRFDIKAEVVKNRVDEIIVAMPSVKGYDLKVILEICRRTKCKMKILPGIYEIIEGGASVSQLRDVDIEDLLGRDPVKLDNEAVSSYLKNKIVLITGGGGSIGSEIARQVSKMQPKKLLLLGKGENSIYEIHQELTNSCSDLKVVPIIADVRDRERISQIMEHFKPQVVFHAAAHKHVPLMEWQPIEAVKNNVLGTWKTVVAADRYKVDKFVLISTDKAVNPTNIMGASKRICEMIVQTYNKLSETEFVAVRFGNVLGSNGSVIPLFKKQIEMGGPVTVTHPDIIRYFMTIPEAVSLVLEAGAKAKGGEIFVLDMGSPVKILDLAHNLIKLSGYVPDEDIKIEFTGLRPGEKLYEELLMDEEGLQDTENSLIHIGKPIELNEDKFFAQLEELKSVAENETEDIRKVIQEIVPTYHPKED